MIRLLTGVTLFFISAGFQAQAVLPDGADAAVLQERYGDWVVICQESKETAAPQCTALQVQTKAGVRVLSAELRGDTETSLTGKLTLPFGLALAEGVTLSVYDKRLDTLHFNTCVPEGCIVPVQWDKEQAKELLKANKWTLTGKNSGDGAETIELQLPVNGLDKALQRIQFLQEEKTDTPPSP
ncbi:invasion associated locus B family protein [Citrobacter amalonaticus]|uniref:invasion associated locus B family protein n=1 Tax=Citrobacter amalonaticus TaxID=35703 RepID=UPI00164FA26F|nr:invasion associated locus B family protein [Citrobacter amalonaticus]MBC6531827.1 Invasion associated locus B family protein [Citrobacter amalonaticus]